MSSFESVPLVAAADAAKERPDDTVLFALPRAQALVVLELLGKLARGDEIAVQQSTIRAITDRIQSSYLADRALRASDLGLSFTVCRHMVQLAERWSGGLLSEREAAALAELSKTAAMGLSAANRVLQRQGRIRPLWKVVEGRMESLN